MVTLLIALKPFVVCCIYHKPRRWDESSSESDSVESDCEDCKHHNSNKNRTESRSSFVEEELEVTH